MNANVPKRSRRLIQNIAGVGSSQFAVVSGHRTVEESGPVTTKLKESKQTESHTKDKTMKKRKTQMNEPSNMFCPWNRIETNKQTNKRLTSKNCLKYLIGFIKNLERKFRDC